MRTGPTSGITPQVGILMKNQYKGGQCMPNKLNVDRLMQVMSEILSDKYDVQFILTARPKDAAMADEKDAA